METGISIFDFEQDKRANSLTGCVNFFIDNPARDVGTVPVLHMWCVLPPWAFQQSLFRSYKNIALCGKQETGERSLENGRKLFAAQIKIKWVGWDSNIKGEWGTKYQIRLRMSAHYQNTLWLHEVWDLRWSRTRCNGKTTKKDLCSCFGNAEEKTFLA